MSSFMMDGKFDGITLLWGILNSMALPGRVMYSVLSVIKYFTLILPNRFYMLWDILGFMKMWDITKWLINYQS